MPILMSDEENEEIYSEWLEAQPKGVPLDFNGLDNLHNKAQLKKVCDYIENLPTDGWDKWYYYHRDLANKIRQDDTPVIHYYQENV